MSPERCKATVFGRSRSEPNHQCKQFASQDGLCYSHLPETIRTREEAALAAAEARIRKANLHRRKLLLIPILDEAKKKRAKIENEAGRLGATMIINILEQKLREK